MTPNEIKQEILAYLNERTDANVSQMCEDLFFENKSQIREMLTEMKHEGVIRMERLRYRITDEGREAIEPCLEELIEMPAPILPDPMELEKAKIERELHDQQDLKIMFMVEFGDQIEVFNNFADVEQYCNHVAEQSGETLQVFKFTPTPVGKFAPKITVEFEAA